MLLLKLQVVAANFSAAATCCSTMFDKRSAFFQRDIKKNHRKRNERVFLQIMVVPHLIPYLKKNSHKSL